MSQTVILELPEGVTIRAEAVARKAQRRLEDVLVEWLDHTAADLPVELLPDDEVLALCDGQMSDTQQDALHDLLALQREGQLSVGDRKQLNELLRAYRRGLVRKAYAWKVAVERDLRPPLN